MHAESKLRTQALLTRFKNIPISEIPSVIKQISRRDFNAHYENVNNLAIK